MSIAFYVVQLKTTFEALTHGHNYKNAISSRPFNKKKTFRFQASKNLSQVTALFPKVTEKIRFDFFLTEILHSMLFFSFSTLPYQRINATVFLFFFLKEFSLGLLHCKQILWVGLEENTMGQSVKLVARANFDLCS